MPPARRRKLEETLAALAEARKDPGTPQAQSLIEDAIRRGPSHAAAKAADLVCDFAMESLVPLLETHFARFLENPVKRDPGCVAKTAFANALVRLELDSESLFLAGVRHRQPEPVWGGNVDTAVDLRGTCALGLAHTTHPDVMQELALLLADPEAPVRASAARALSSSGRREAIPILLLRARLPDRDPEETEQLRSECLQALLELDFEETLSFVEDFLRAPEDANWRAAAFALGRARQPSALPVLRSFYERSLGGEPARAALLAIAMLRSDESLAYLLALVTEGSGPQAREAIEALGLYSGDASLGERVRDAANANSGAELTRDLGRHFPEI